MNTNAIQQFLSDFISIPSVSTDPSRSIALFEAADFLQKKFDQMGFQTRQIKHPQSSPLLIAHKKVSDNAPTLGIYGHYDVQPEDPVEEWKSSPFVLTHSNGKFIGRGVADNKGHVVQNIAAVEELIYTKKLQQNIVFILEGEEEVGSVHFEELLKEEYDILKKIDVFYVTDTGMKEKNVPQIYYALRGLVYFELSVQTGERDLHSGIYGNRVLNPIHVLSNLLSQIKNIKTGSICIEGFYDDVRKFSESELKLLQKMVNPINQEKEDAHTYSLVSIDTIHPSLVSKIMPSCDAHGIMGGYTGVGSKTIIPKNASMKFSFRLVEFQDPEKIEQLVSSFINKHMPAGVKYKLITHSKSSPFYTSVQNSYVERTARILKETFNHGVVFNRSGGSIPAAEIFQRVFHKPVILTGFTLPDDHIHSPNENFDEEMFWKGIEALCKIYR